MLIAIDHGNYAIKTPNYTFVSGLAEHTVRPPLADELMEYAGRFWTLTSKRLSYMRDKTQDERYFILTLFAIAKELEAAGHYMPTCLLYTSLEQFHIVCLQSEGIPFRAHLRD